MALLRIERICLAAILILAGALTESPGAYGQETEGEGPDELYRRIAVGLTERALLVDDPRDEGRIATAARAARIDPTLGDPAFILAEALIGDQGSVGRREQLLRRALSSDLERVSRDEVVHPLAILLREQGRHDEVVELLHPELADDADDADTPPISALIAWVDAPDRGGVEGSPDAAAPDSPEPLELLYLLSLAESGPRWYGARLMERLRARYPRSIDLARADWARQGRVSLSALEWLDAYERGWGAAPPAVYLQFLGDDPPAGLAAPLLARYRAAGGTDAMAEVLAHAAGVEDALSAIGNEDPVIHEKAAWELLGGGDSDGSDLPPPFREVLARIDAGSAVTVVRDFDRNGFWEERYHFSRGSLQRWELDRDQDGRTTEVAVVDAGRIRYYRWDESTGETVQVQYSGFPRVDRVRWIDKTGAIEWRPPRPVPYEVRRLEIFSLEPRDVLAGSIDAAGSVDVADDVTARFARQRLSDDSREVSIDRHAAELARMREWGMIP
jgi:hypothetical protein